MAETQFGRIGKIIAFRQNAGGFIGANQNFFEEIGNGIEVVNLRFTFKIEKNLKKEPNSCELAIYNLTEHSRSELQQLPLRVKLEAGYETEGTRLMFVGDAIKRGVWSKHDGSDWITTFQLSDGLRSFSQARVNKSYKAGTTVRTIMADVARTMSLDLPKDFVADPSLTIALKTGEVVTGWSSDQLTRLLAPYGYGWSMQNGRLQILKDEQVRPGIRLINQDNGMIGSPEMGTPDKKGKPPSVTVKTTLYPEIQPGEKMRLEAVSLKGDYKIIRVSHNGDTAGGDWYTEVEAKPL